MDKFEVKLEASTYYVTDLFGGTNESGISFGYESTMDELTKNLAEKLAKFNPHSQVFVQADTWASTDGNAHTGGVIYLCRSQKEVERLLEGEAVISTAHVEGEGQSSCGRYFIEYWKIGEGDIPLSVRNVCPNCGQDKDLGFNYEGTHSSCKNGQCWSGPSTDLIPD